MTDFLCTNIGLMGIVAEKQWYDWYKSTHSTCFLRKKLLFVVCLPTVQFISCCSSSNSFHKGNDLWSTVYRFK